METMNPYYIVKTAEDFYADEAAAPIIGALIGGGIGAYTGKGWKSKLLRGLAGAGIGGGIGMGANWIRNRLGYGQATEAQRERYTELGQKLKDTQQQHSTLRKNVEEIYKNLYGFENYTPGNEPGLEQALRDITQSIESRKVEEMPIGQSMFNIDLFPKDFKVRTPADILGATDIQRQRDTQQAREELTRPIYYETFKPIVDMRNIYDGENNESRRENARYLPAYINEINPWFTRYKQPPSTYKNPGKLKEFSLPNNIQKVDTPNKSFYSDDLINPIIGALLGTGIGAYTGKDKKSKIKRGLIGLLLGGGVGLGANWLKDKLDSSQFRREHYKSENSFNEHINTYKPELRQMSDNIHRLYKFLNGQNNNLTPEEESEKLKKYTKELAYYPLDRYLSIPEKLSDTYESDSLADAADEESKEGLDLHLPGIFKQISKFNLNDEVKVLQQIIKEEVSNKKTNIEPEYLNVLKTVTPEEIATANAELYSDEIPLSSAITTINNLGYTYDADAQEYLKELKESRLMNIARIITYNRKTSSKEYRKLEALKKERETTDSFWGQLDLDNEINKLENQLKKEYPVLVANRDPSLGYSNIGAKISKIFSENWNKGEGRFRHISNREKDKDVFARARALSKDKLPTIDDY